MRLSISVVILAALCSACGVRAANVGSVALDRPINQGWRFLREEASAPPAASDNARAQPGYDDSAWETVTLPHTVRLESPTHGPDYFKGVCWYRRQVAVPPAWRGKRVAIAFDGAMQRADVWVNGRHALEHLGGYLPFVVDLTPDLETGRPIVLALRLDNRASPEFPPGSDRIDFAYYGGLYRPVRLLVTDRVRITDPIEANRVAGGGTFVRYEHVTAESADVVVQVNVRNDDAAAVNVTVENRLIGPDNQSVAVAQSPARRVEAGRDIDILSRLVVLKPLLWHPDHPYLYRIVATVRRNGVVSDREETRIGIRHLDYTDDGFFLNGEKIVIRGANRHMSFPWIGNAASDNLQYRDIRLLKEAGFNFVRLAHYPQSSAVMDACDELGVLALVCTPGWQFFSDTDAFKTAARQNVREMIRWHRNHPSAVLWEVSLNETYGHDDFYRGSVAVAHEEYPGGQLFTSGDSNGSKSARHYDLTYTEWDGFYRRPLNPDARIAKGLHREYGDYEFGGQESTTRVSRRDGEGKLRLQAWNFQWSHNMNLSWPWTIGDAIWAGIDTASALDHFDASGNGRGSWWGPLDLARLPKFSYYFYQSQRDPDVVRPSYDSGPMVYIAGYWTARPSPSKVVVYSNGDEVELLVNGRRIARQKPDSGPDSSYGPTVTLESEHPRAGAPFDGGNCRHLDHPPFTFVAVPYEAGELKAVAYRRGRAVAEHVRRTPGPPAALRLRAPTLGRPLTSGAGDAIFVYADVVDANGEVVPDADRLVRFVAEGPVRLVGPHEAPAEAGIAATLIEAGDAPGSVIIRASAAGLRSAALTVAVASGR
jgi:beta-galactosidase